MNFNKNFEKVACEKVLKKAQNKSSKKHQIIKMQKKFNLQKFHSKYNIFDQNEQINETQNRASALEILQNKYSWDKILQ